MNVTVKIDCGNAAFDEPDVELSRILRELADRFAQGMLPVDEVTIRDINGNKVGSVEVTSAVTT